MVTDTHVAVLRAALSGDDRAVDMLSGISGLGPEQELSILTAMMFINAARRRFAPTWSGSDVIRFVGQVGGRDHGEYSDIDAEAAEQMLISALSDKPLRGQFDEFAKGYAQAALLKELTSELDSDQLDALLEEAREQSNRWLVGQW